MKKKKLTTQLLNQLQELRKTRRLVDADLVAGHYINFLSSFMKHASLMHYLLENKPPGEIRRVAISQYLVFLVSCWESFFRDAFVFVIGRDSTACQVIVNELNIDGYENMLGSLTLPEYLSKSFNFQNLEDIENAFQSIFNGSMINTLGQYVIPVVGIKSKLAKGLCLDNNLKNWKELIGQSFAERHKIIHDANYINGVSYDNSFIQKAEAAFLLLPQILSVWISEEYSIQHSTIRMKKDTLAITKGVLNDDSIPYIFTVDELISNDWVVG